MRHIDPIAQLMQEHDDALLQLSKLRKATKTIAEKGFSDQEYQLVLNALKFIEEEVGVHNKSEEDALFPVLERYVEGPTKLMREDHKIMKKEFRKLHSAVMKVGRQKKNAGAAQDLEAIARSIIQRFVNHIHKENHILFPLVQKFLTKDALREVARRML
jgi:hemerythrin-like domain-containing protein